jgi:hypothetical protein
VVQRRKFLRATLESCGVHVISKCFSYSEKDIWKNLKFENIESRFFNIVCPFG